jgi:hypothetical protein
MAKKYDSSTEQAIADVEKFDNNVKELTLDRMNLAPKLEVESQTKLSQTDLSKSKDIYLKPKRTIGSREKFNEKYRDDLNFAKEYVQFIAENHECIGENIDLWTKPYPGMPAEEWNVPTNKPVWAPRYVAERIKNCSYHRMSMDQSKQVGTDSSGSTYFGAMVVDNIKQRLDAIPVSSRKSIFMGATGL